ncbi:hypothetical protein HDU96_007221 [Phlyctochytrium bullatum]|nr:hypothetical protein HDU96_007221 [Phlyctochytrium bullatum]
MPVPIPVPTFNMAGMGSGAGGAGGGRGLFGLPLGGGQRAGGAAGAGRQTGSDAAGAAPSGTSAEPGEGTPEDMMSMVTFAVVVEAVPLEEMLQAAGGVPPGSAAAPPTSTLPQQNQPPRVPLTRPDPRSPDNAGRQAGAPSSNGPPSESGLSRLLTEILSGQSSWRREHSLRRAQRAHAADAQTNSADTQAPVPPAPEEPRPPTEPAPGPSAMFAQIPITFTIEGDFFSDPGEDPSSPPRAGPTNVSENEGETGFDGNRILNFNEFLSMLSGRLAATAPGGAQSNPSEPAPAPSAGQSQQQQQPPPPQQQPQRSDIPFFRAMTDLALHAMQRQILERMQRASSAPPQVDSASEAGAPPTGNVSPNPLANTPFGFVEVEIGTVGGENEAGRGGTGDTEGIWWTSSPFDITALFGGQSEAGAARDEPPNAPFISAATSLDEMFPFPLPMPGVGGGERRSAGPSPLVFLRHVLERLAMGVQSMQGQPPASAAAIEELREFAVPWRRKKRAKTETGEGEAWMCPIFTDNPDYNSGVRQRMSARRTQAKQATPAADAAVAAEPSEYEPVAEGRKRRRAGQEGQDMAGVSLGATFQGEGWEDVGMVTVACGEDGIGEGGPFFKRRRV